MDEGVEGSRVHTHTHRYCQLSPCPQPLPRKGPAWESNVPSPKNTRALGSFFSSGSRFSSGSPGLSPDLPELSLPSSEKAAALLSPPQGKPKVWDRLGQFHLPGLPKTELTKDMQG